MAKNKGGSNRGTSKTQKYYAACPCNNEAEVHIVVTYGATKSKDWTCKACGTKLPKGSKITSNK